MAFHSESFFFQNWGGSQVSEYWGLTRVSEVHGTWQESVGISNRLLTPAHTTLRRPPRSPFSYPGVISPRQSQNIPDLYMREVKMEPFILLAFLPPLYSMLCTFPLWNVVLLECAKGHLGVEKGPIVDLGSKTPQNAGMPTKQGKTQQDHDWPHHVDWPQIGHKWQKKERNNAKRTNGSIFTRPPSS